MKGWFKLLVLAALPILAVTMVVDQGLAADKGSQLIFITDAGEVNYVSITNTSVNIPDLDTVDGNDTDMGVNQMEETAMAVTVLVQIYDDELAPVLEYLRVILGGGTVLVDPMSHMIPGTETSVTDVIGASDSSRYVVTVTAVRSATALFPDYLAEDMHKMQNIDAIGDTAGVPLAGDFATDDQIETNEDHEKDSTMKNVGDLTVANSQPASFNYLAGHQTSAQVSSASGGTDQTASWGINALTRMARAVSDDDMVASYTILEGSADGTRLAEMIHGGDATVTPNNNTVTGYTDTEMNELKTVRGVNWGALVSSSLHGLAHQEVQFLSVADDYGKSDEFGDYKLIPARTKYKVVLHDAAGGVFVAPGAEDGQVYRGGEEEEMETPMPDIAVSGISVMLDPGDCGGMMTMGGWSLADLTGLIPAASDGTDDFMGLGAMVDPMMNASMGWVKFLRHPQSCEEDFGDGDGASLGGIEDPDGVPTTDERKFTTGTVVIEKGDTDRVYVTTGQVILKFETPDATFGASWMLTTK